MTVLVDGEDVTVPDRDTTPNEIIGLAGLPAATHYLVLVRGRERDSFQGKGDEPLRVHEREQFVTVSTEPTPTS